MHLLDTYPPLTFSSLMRCPKFRWLVAVAKSFFSSLMRCCRNQKRTINLHLEKE
jgi:hypothetical protein